MTAAQAADALNFLLDRRLVDVAIALVIGAFAWRWLWRRYMAVPLPGTTAEPLEDEA